MRGAIPVFAVVRIDEYESEEESITIKEIVPTMEEAIQEVERLNKLNADKNCHYFWQLSRYFPNGRANRSVDDPETNMSRNRNPGPHNPGRFIKR